MENYYSSPGVSTDVLLCVRQLFINVLYSNISTKYLCVGTKFAHSRLSCGGGTKAGIKIVVSDLRQIAYTQP